LSTLPLLDDPSKDLYLVLPHGERSLDKMLPLAPMQRTTYFQQLLGALAHMHAAQVVHRDLKPSNLVIVRGVLRVADFGAATALDCLQNQWSPIASPRLTTHSYCAPEVILAELMGTRPLPVGKHVDIWAAGCIYEEMGTRQVLFGGQPSRQAVLSLILSALPHEREEAYSLIRPAERCDLWPQNAVTLQCLRLHPEKRPTAAVLARQFSVDVPQDLVDPAPIDEPEDADLPWDDLGRRLQDIFAQRDTQRGCNTDAESCRTHQRRPTLDSEASTCTATPDGFLAATPSTAGMPRIKFNPTLEYPKMHPQSHLLQTMPPEQMSDGPGDLVTPEFWPQPIFESKPSTDLGFNTPDVWG
jgi:serine/threonine protein kinase